MVLGGGGDRSAYEVGAIKGLLEALDADKSRFNVISAASTGSINAYFLAMHKVGEERNAVKEMSSFWTSITKKDVYEIWNTG